jgi:hypothetical protein
MIVSWTEFETRSEPTGFCKIQNLIQIRVAVGVQTTAAASAVPRIKLCAAKTQGELLALPPRVT